MSFTTAYISDVARPAYVGGDLKLSWTSTAPPGYALQVYINGALAFHREAPATSCRLAWPRQPTQIDIGHVLLADARTSFAPALPPRPSVRATLSWRGGTLLDASGGRDVAGFRVYGSPSPGTPADRSTPLADISAYVGGIVTDGFGLGKFGDGGFGMMPGDYSWTSPPLRNGTYHFDVVAYDSRGIEGDAATSSYTAAGPPAPPDAFDGTLDRLAYSLLGHGQAGFGGGGFGMPAAQLTWQPSPWW